MAQAVRVQACSSSRGICDVQSGAGTSFRRSAQFSPFCTVAPILHIFIFIFKCTLDSRPPSQLCSTDQHSAHAMLGEQTLSLTGPSACFDQAGPSSRRAYELQSWSYPADCRAEQNGQCLYKVRLLRAAHEGLFFVIKLMFIQTNSIWNVSVVTYIYVVLRKLCAIGRIL
jgi:hypothetical protein